MKVKTIRSKLMIVFLSIVVTPLLFVGIYSYNKAKAELEKVEFAELKSVNAIKKAFIKQFFKEREEDIRVFANTPFVQQAMNGLVAAENSAQRQGLFGTQLESSKGFLQAQDKYKDNIEFFLKTYNYYDIYLIDAAQGVVLYSHKRESDYLTTLSKESTSLSDAWKGALRTNEVFLTDTKPYAPSQGLPAQFLAHPVELQGKIIGVVAFEIPLDSINQIMSIREGLGKTGDSYLVGSDRLMRSDAYTDRQEHNVLTSFTKNIKVETVAVEKALQGKKDAEIVTDFRGNPALTAFDRIDIGNGIRWAIISEIETSEAFAGVTKLRNAVFLATIVIALAMLAFSFLASRHISALINRILATVQKQKDGDLRSKIDLDRRDEIGELFHAYNRMIDSLRDIVTQARQSVNQTAVSASQVLAATQEQTAGASEQSAATTEVLATVEELANTANQIANRAQEVNDSTEKMIGIISEMQKSISDTAKKILLLGEKSQTIGNIINVIESLSEQTNLLALNAAIEAARAGEAGKGFAVVAGEVRRLSERSAESTEEIRTLITEIQAETNSAVMGVEDTTRQVGKSVEGVKQSAQQIKEISMSTNQQKSAFSQVVTAIRNIDDVTKQFVASTKQTSEAFNLLKGESENLTSIISNFKVH